MLQEYPGAISPLAVAELKAYERLLGAFPSDDGPVGFSLAPPVDGASEPPVAPLLGSFESLSVDPNEGEEDVYSTEGYDTARFVILIRYANDSQSHIRLQLDRLTLELLKVNLGNSLC
eukprot:8168765-Pyramimonas_sp.AAC.1